MQAHQFQFSAELIREIKSVQRNATDTEASELFCESFGKVKVWLHKINEQTVIYVKFFVDSSAHMSGTLTDGSKRKHFIEYND